MKRKILIVDDEPINLEFFEVMLSKLGFEVGKAVNGEEALEKVVEFEPDLIILDNIMPKLTGWDVTKKLKQDEEFKDFSSIPIIMFSAMDGVNDKIEGLELGVDDYITKPFVFREVLARIKAVMRHRELALQIERRERRIEVTESLNGMLLAFFDYVRTPLQTLLDKLNNVDPANKNESASFYELVKEKGEDILSKFQGLEEKIENLKIKGNDLKKGDLSPEELERQFIERFKDYQQTLKDEEDRE
ncbi:MAG: response regulator [Spirochaetales bacterium]|nr:response regulator [Spirochaetales bacterium]